MCFWGVACCHATIVCVVVAAVVFVLQWGRAGIVGGGAQQQGPRLGGGALGARRGGADLGDGAPAGGAGITVALTATNQTFNMGHYRKD